MVKHDIIKKTLYVADKKKRLTKLLRLSTKCLSETIDSMAKMTYMPGGPSDIRKMLNVYYLR